MVDYRGSGIIISAKNRGCLSQCISNLDDRDVISGAGLSVETGEYGFDVLGRFSRIHGDNCSKMIRSRKEKKDGQR